LVPFLIYGDVSDSVQGTILFVSSLVAAATFWTLSETNGKAMGVVGPEATIVAGQTDSDTA